MASPKYFRVRESGEKLAIFNFSNAGNILRDGFHQASFLIDSSQYDANDQIEIRLEGAIYVLGFLIQNKNTGEIITLEPGVPPTSYTKGTEDMSAGIYLRTSAIPTPIDIAVNIWYTVESGSAITYATLTAS
jgi:hypothetical protein